MACRALSQTHPDFDPLVKIATLDIYLVIQEHPVEVWYDAPGREFYWTRADHVPPDRKRIPRHAQCLGRFDAKMTIYELLEEFEFAVNNL